MLPAGLAGKYRLAAWAPQNAPFVVRGYTDHALSLKLRRGRPIIYHSSLITSYSVVTGLGGDAESGEPLVLDCLWVWA
jgi:hypothetical protein